jgi:triacylglycerol esterase/lipase EstA (alpha/beta hydrolase family)
MGCYLASFVVTMAFSAGTATPQSPKETVVLVHGQGRTRASLVILQHRLKRAGYRTATLGYSGAFEDLEEITNKLHRVIEKDVQTQRYHLVGHSLGNVIIRSGFRRRYRAGLGRIVMLAPPNSPAALAKRWHKRLWYRVIFGDPGQKLADDKYYAALPVPTVEFGVIAGSKSHTDLHSDAQSDGVVLLENTKLPGMADWVVVEHTHTFIMNTTNTFELLVRFLRTGRFAATESDAGGGTPDSK